MLCEKEAFFLGSPCSFYIGVVSLTPMMAQLDLAQLERIDLDQLERDQLERIGLDQLERIALEELPQPAYARQLWGKELEKPSKIPELQSLQRKELAKMTAKSLDKIELERTALHMSFHSFLQTSLRKAKLTAEGACMTQCLTAKPDEGRRAFALGDAAWRSESAIQLQFLGKELVINLAIPEQEQLSLSGGASGALAAFSNSSSTKPPRRTLHSISSTLLSIFFILMVSIFPSNINNNFIHCCAFQLVEQDELSTNFGQWEEESEEILELQNLLWDQELENLPVDKPFQLDLPYDHLGKENLWSVQLQQNLLENDEQKELEDQELQEKNFHKSFQEMIFLKKLDALLLEWHFAKAASHQLYGIKAWEKHREASKEISFDKKKGDKELPQQLRRQELDCKDLRSDSFRALCPTNFEENNFTEETFTKSRLEKETFRGSNLTKNNLTESSFTRSSLTENSLTESSLTESRLTESSFRRSSLTRTNLTKSSFTEHSFLENSFLENTFFKNSFSENNFYTSPFQEATFQEANFQGENFTDSSLTEESFSNTSLGEDTFSKSSFEKSSFADSSFTEKPFPDKTFSDSSLEESSFQKSNLEKNNLDRSSLHKHDFDQHSFKTCSFEKSSFEESSFDTSSFPKQSFSESSLDQSSLQPNSFEDSLEDSSFKGASLATASLQRTACTTELQLLQRQPSTSELAKLERGTLTLELGQLEEPALEKAAFNLKLDTARLCLSRSFGLPAGTTLLDCVAPRGSAKAPASAHTSLTVTSLSLRNLRGSSLAWCFPAKGSFSSPSLAEPDFGIRETKMVHFGPFWPKEVYFGPLRSANSTLATPEKPSFPDCGDFGPVGGRRIRSLESLDDVER